MSTRSNGWASTVIAAVEEPGRGLPAMVVLAGLPPFEGQALRVPLDESSAHAVMVAMEQSRAPSMWQRFERLAAHLGERLGIYIVRGEQNNPIAILRTREGLSLCYTLVEIGHALEACVRLELSLFLELALLENDVSLIEN